MKYLEPFFFFFFSSFCCWCIQKNKNHLLLHPLVNITPLLTHQNAWDQQHPLWWSFNERFCVFCLGITEEPNKNEECLPCRVSPWCARRHLPLRGSCPGEDRHGIVTRCGVGKPCPVLQPDHNCYSKKKKEETKCSATVTKLREKIGAGICCWPTALCVWQ